MPTCDDWHDVGWWSCGTSPASRTTTPPSRSISHERDRALASARRAASGRRVGTVWPPWLAVDAESEALLQDAIDGELDARGREARDRLLAEHDDAGVRATALRDLGTS
jgi:hypothetical protein